MRVRQTSGDELTSVLRDKQSIKPNEFDGIVTADASDRVRQLSSILRDKGLNTAAEAASLHVSSTPSTFLAPAAEPVTTAPGMAAGQPDKPADPGRDPTRKFNTYVDFPYSTARQPRAGEPGRLPGVEWRLGFSTSIEDWTANVGVGAHFGSAKNTSTIDCGESYAGRAPGIFSGGISQTVMPFGGSGVKGVGTRGGWLQVQLNLTERWQSNTADGIDAPVIRNLLTASRSSLAECHVCSGTASPAHDLSESSDSKQHCRPLQAGSRLHVLIEANI
jgi:hypothetical protein